MAKKILIVDDEENIVEVLKARLEHKGYEVITGSDGMEGLAKARSEKPDLVILDVMMPKMDGYKVCHMLKFDSNYQHIPVILLTARIQDADVKMGKDQKADAYMTKPYKPEEILSTVEKLLAGQPT